MKNNVKRKDGAICDIPSKLNGKHITAYLKWDNMLKRALSEDYKTKKPTYKDVTVCQEWMTFSNFKKWFDENYKLDFELDKDILVKGNKHYSPSTCCFIPRYVNCLFGNITQTCNLTSKYQGVSWSERDNTFRATCREFYTKKQKSIGRYNTEEEAFEAYKQFKNIQIQKCADYALNKGDINKQIYDSLLQHKY